MNIGMVGHIYPVPPLGYGGVERVVAWWCEELERLGHKVFLFADPRSLVKVHKLIACYGSGDRFVDKILENSNEIEVIHDNNDDPNPDIRRWKTKPYIFTVHACRWTGNPNPVFLSFNQARFYKYENPIVINNGFPIDRYEFVKEKEDFILWCGSIRACKAPEMAIQLAIDCNFKLKIIGPIQDDNYNFLKNFKGDIEYLGEMGEERIQYFQKAKAFLYTFSDSWMEGFNLVNIEALLSGTPLIAYESEMNQIAREQIEDEVSGFICKDFESMKRIFKEKLYENLKPEDCRKQGEKFNIKTTVWKYIQIYQKVISGDKW